MPKIFFTTKRIITLCAALTQFAFLDLSYSKQKYITPTRKVSLDRIPEFVDDLDFEGVETAVNRQVARYRTRDMNGTISLGGETYPLLRVDKTLKAFRAHVRSYKKCLEAKNKIETCRAQMNIDLQAKFNIYEPDLQPGDPRHGDAEPVLFTGYYTPAIHGTTQPDQENKYAIYRSPGKSDKDRTATRNEIDFQGQLKNKALEVFYTKDLFNLYLLHVQGGGKLRYESKGKSAYKYITYDGTNGQSWNFISKYMLEKKYIKDASIDAQREYLEKNPHREQEIYSTCPSYVYFKPTVEPPLGNDRVPLTDNRSIATDSSLYAFKGMLAFVAAQRPNEVQHGGKVEYKPYSRFYLDQDTGGAIKGKGRVDLYFGEGDYAELAAYNTKHTGHLYFLMLK